MSAFFSTSPVFLSTPSARRATGKYIEAIEGTDAISIHALREEGDPEPPCRVYPCCEISIHALREEGDPRARVTSASSMISIHALREEGDSEAHSDGPEKRHFYPRPPRGGRLCCGLQKVQQRIISIHALREEGDGPVRVGDLSDIEISIHALREEGDIKK